ALDTWAALDLSGAAEWTAGRRELLARVLRAGAGSDPRAAAALAARGIEQKSSTWVDVGEAIGQAWVERDVVEGLRYLETAGLAESDPAGAAAFAAAMPLEPSFYNSLGEMWFYRDGATACSWARGLADPVLRDQALIGVLRLANSWEPPQAATLAVEISQPEA